MLNDGALYTTSPAVTLKTTMTDTDTTGYQMKVWGVDGVEDEANAAWETFAAEKSITLPTGEGLKTVHVRVRDDVGNETAAVSDTITLDTAVPVGNVILHYDVTHKNCPAPMVADMGLWKKFKERLEEQEMKIYTSIKEMPAWARPTFEKLVRLGVVAQDKQGKISVQESSLQPMVYNDRLGLIR